RVGSVDPLINVVRCRPGPFPGILKLGSAGGRMFVARRAPSAPAPAELNLCSETSTVSHGPSGAGCLERGKHPSAPAPAEPNVCSEISTPQPRLQRSRMFVARQAPLSPGSSGAECL